jgi:AcrR family transcriptional regulator
VPKLWTETIEGHRREVREAILDATWELAVQRGPLSVTMSEVAQAAGIGRATLYKYFSDVEAILHAWHERQIGRHLEQLAAARDEHSTAGDRLDAVLHAYATIMHQRAHHGDQLGTLLHRTHSGQQAVAGQHQLHELIRDLLAQAVPGGDVRDDVTPDELATYCLHALAAAGRLPSDDAVRRLVALILSGLRRTTA